jgi:formate C-acetyltransferase
MSLSVGLPDRALARFAAEVDDDVEAAVSLIRAFLLKVAGNSFVGRGSKTQAVTVGGADVDGDATSVVTAAFLEAFDRTPVADPHLFLRWHENLPVNVRRRACAMLARGRSMPLLVNDHQVVPGLLAAGIPEALAWSSCIVGCNELSLPGRCPQSGLSPGLGFNDLDILDQVMRTGAADQPSADDLLDSYEVAVRERVRAGVSQRRAQIDRVADRVPFPFLSACYHGCIEAGDDYARAGDHADLFGVFIRGTSNAVNALAAVSETMARRGLPELLAGVEGRDPAVLAAIEAAPKWGNDEERVDALAVQLNRRRDRALRAVAAEAGLPPFTLCHVVRSLHHLDGRRIGHTLDGRAAGTPVADSVGAVVGTQREGPTAMLNSVLKLDAGRWFSGIYNLNLTLPGGAQAQPEILDALVAGFFRDGGQELQINVLDAARLRAARCEPERYRDLVVRIAGLNARFVELSPVEQDELIRRADLAAGAPAGAAPAPAADPRRV